ncbi:hypothetical protein HU200_067469 [Digitaria exilis]|uniref:Coenzyme Q-binding protein COQ10 START domain-containing protein n=1 Tax=Digitaria exilis TaxID=1010633 RepID=A0A835A0I8_9POAL|nr:hypothetical protein HU200_067469 [Digitaria exilis]
MACSATCCRASSSPSCGLRVPATTTSSSPARIRLIFPSSTPRRRVSSRAAASPEPAAVEDEDDEDLWSAADDIGFEIQVSKVGGKRNRRLVRARVRVDAPLEAVWATLTDYEGLADFIPGLSECRLLEQADGFARLYQVMPPIPLSFLASSNPIPTVSFISAQQVGEQDLALGFKFNAKGTIDCYEGDMESLPAAGVRRRREIAFNMIQGDFKVFQGKWTVEEADHDGGIGGDPERKQTTLLSYLVELEPKLWVPVRLLQGRICSEIKNNLVSIRDQAHSVAVSE